MQKERAALKAKYDEYQKPKKDAIHEKIKAQNEMNPKRMKKIYKYFENKRDDIAIKVMETFVAILRGKHIADIGPEDVELYLRRHASLMCACNKLQPD